MTNPWIPGGIGFASALIVALLVQVFVIPLVQRRTRRLERWEKILYDLLGLVEQELPRALGALRNARYTEVLLKQLKDAEGVDQTKLESLTADERAKGEEADKAVGEVLARATSLEWRLSRVRPSAPVWEDLNMCMRWVSVELFATEDWWPDAEARTTDEWKDVWDRVDKRQDDLLKVVMALAARGKPPELTRCAVPGAGSRLNRSESRDG